MNDVGEELLFAGSKLPDVLPVVETLRGGATLLEAIVCRDWPVPGRVWPVDTLDGSVDLGSGTLSIS
jgi:hypothetical protein